MVFALLSGMNTYVKVSCYALHGTFIHDVLQELQRDVAPKVRVAISPDGHTQVVGLQEFTIAAPGDLEPIIRQIRKYRAKATPGMHTMPYHTTPYHTTPHHTIPHHTTPHVGITSTAQRRPLVRQSHVRIHNGATSGFETCFLRAPAPLVPGLRCQAPTKTKTHLESRF